MKTKYGLFVALALALGTIAGRADTIANLNTGVDNNGNSLGYGVADPHWAVTPSIGGSQANPLVNVLANSQVTGVNWGQAVGIWPGMGDGGSYTYTLHFSFDPSLYLSVSLGAAAWADDSITSAVLNTTGLGLSYANGATFFSTGNMSSFVNGDNTLTLTVNNSNPGFTGLIVAGGITATAVPEASEWAMLIGAAGLGLLSYRKQLAALLQREAPMAV